MDEHEDLHVYQIYVDIECKMLVQHERERCKQTYESSNAGSGYAYQHQNQRRPHIYKLNIPAALLLLWTG